VPFNPVSSHSGGFNGGTLTSNLTLSPTNPATVPLVIRPLPNASTLGTDSIEVYDDTGTVRFLSIDADGLLRFRCDTNFGNDFRITHDAAILVDIDGDGFIVYDGSGNPLLNVQRNAGIGFYGHAAAAQQTLHSATATPELIALALEANGLCGGD
jgi:hypothetical protein